MWPIFGTFEKWTCQALNNYVGSRSKEEKEYVKIWEDARVGLLPVRTHKSPATKNGTWDPLDHLPPPYIIPQHQPVIPDAPSMDGTVAAAAAIAVPEPAPVPRTYPQLPTNPPLLPVGDEKQTIPAKVTDSPLATRTRLQTKKLSDKLSEDVEEKSKLFPLRQIPTTPGVIGYINIPINTGDVRAFKKEMGKLMDDPLGVADRLDEFLGTSIYSNEDIGAILRSLFNNEEREIIK